jgi:hypothetical protein
LIVWFPSGYEEYAKWSEVEEAAIASLVAGKIRSVRRALAQVRKEKTSEREVDLGLGPGGRRYYIEIAVVDSGPDFMQMIGQAPSDEVSADLLAGPLPDEPLEQRFLIARIYDDGDENSLGIIGATETKRLSSLILAQVN